MPARFAALLLASLIGAGCSNARTPDRSAENPPATADPAGGTSAGAYAQGLTFSECMRQNGVKDFPDPDASGPLTIDAIANGSSVDISSAAFEQAISACKDLEPPGFTGGKRSAEQQSASLTFAQCMRENGVKDFPDPAKGEPLVNTNLIPSSAEPGGMTIINAAMQKCGDVVADALGGQQ